MAPNVPSSDVDPPSTPPIVVHHVQNPRILLLGLGLLAVAVLVWMALYLTDPHSPPSIAWYWPQVAGALIGGILGVGLVSSLRRRHLTYDSQTRTVTARDRIWGLWREYPCEGFDRLEYEAGTGRLYQVRADGKRRRVPVDRHEAVRAEWRAFIDQFERDHAPAEPESS